MNNEKHQEFQNVKKRNRIIAMLVGIRAIFRKKITPDFSDVQQPEHLLSASKDHPLISTLVYKNSNIDYPTSETFNQDKVLVNAKQALASMDHTTASMH